MVLNEIRKPYVRQEGKLGWMTHLKNGQTKIIESIIFCGDLGNEVTDEVLTAAFKISKSTQAFSKPKLSEIRKL